MRALLTTPPLIVITMEEARLIITITMTMKKHLLIQLMRMTMVII